MRRLLGLNHEVFLSLLNTLYKGHFPNKNEDEASSNDHFRYWYIVS